MSALGAAIAARTADPRRAAFYADVGDWCLQLLASAVSRPLVVGINGPQGGGKSTLAAALVDASRAVGIRAVALSIDDFYLTHREQRALAAAHPGDRTLEHRGYPGTHDVALGRRTLDALKAGSTVKLPAYDKSAEGGRGDRAPDALWRDVAPPIDVVWLEGWMLGFRALPDDDVAPALRTSNAQLRAYDAWSDALDALVILRARALDDVVAWRIDAERARRTRGDVALSDDDARDYIERFLPAYRAYAPQLESAWAGRPTRVYELSADRLPAR